MSKSAFKFSAFKFTVATVVALSVSGCTAQYRDHGYVPDEVDLEQVVVGVDNRSTVQEVLGSPLGSGVMEDGAIFYISTKVKHYAFYEPKVVSREMLVVTFDAEDQVENIEKFGLEDGRVVTLSRRVTEAPVKGPKFLKQILGNLGNFNPAGLLGG
jgi:outer membrane protein assembly factor BamE (lipoprotein component of BamABCDE complex)